MKGPGKVFISTILLITLQFSLFNAVIKANTSNSPYFTKLSADTTVKTKPADSTKAIKISKNTLKAKVDYTARDSIRFDIQQQKLYLYGDANVKYEKIELKAGYVELDFDKNTVFAAGAKDSNGKLVEKPIFSENGKPIHSDTMYYNFKTKKGKIKVITTEEGEGRITARIAKKDSNDVSFVRNGHYTTCSLDHPHFYIASNKMKVIPNDKIVTGPAVLVMGDVPTPLMVPFGFFPNRKGRANGILFPTYGESNIFGFNLQDGGYYFGLGDNFDMAIRGDIYSRGSWALKLGSNYLKRYRYSGHISLRFGVFKYGEQEFTDYRKTNDFTILWTHTQDQKASPTTKFNANVNIQGNGTYNKTMPTNLNNYLTSTYSSAISWQKTGQYYNFSTGLTQRQNTRNHNMDLSFPNATLSVPRIYPASFFRREGVSKAQWYDKIGISYSGEFQNSVSALDRNIIKPSILDSVKAGIRHSIPISTSFNFNPFVITPSANFNSLWYFDYTKQYYSKVDHKVVNGQDTVIQTKDTLITQKVHEFRTVNTYNVGISATTKLYGMYQIKNSKIKVIRHVITPSIGFSYRPDYGLGKYNYYESIYDPYSSKPMEYSYFQNNVFSGPSKGKDASLSFSIGNNVEMKVRPSKKDTSNADQKITLIENFTISSSYNYALQELSPFALRLNTKLFKIINVNADCSVDPYKQTETGYRYKQLVWKEGKIGILTRATLSLSTNFNNSKKNKDKSGNKKPDIPKNIDQSAAQMAYVQSHPGYYVDFDVPWNINISYNIAYSKPYSPSYIESIESKILRERMSLFNPNSIEANGDFSLTPKWKIGVRTGYDLVGKGITASQINVSRDLHCWELHFNWIVGTHYQSYMLNINVKSSMLKDLKLTRHRDWRDYQ